VHASFRKNWQNLGKTHPNPKTEHAVAFFAPENPLVRRIRPFWGLLFQDLDMPQMTPSFNFIFLIFLYTMEFIKLGI
jgi:hypothetical protein